MMAGNMQFRQLGSSSLMVSAMGLGCNNFGVIPESNARAVIHQALDMGINFFDTADCYAAGRSEESLGRWLKGKRDQVLLATKFGHPNSFIPPDRPCSARHIIKALEHSLRRLQTSWIDLYQIHFPDPGTPISETLEALDILVRQGKVRHLGVSNFNAAQLTEISMVARHFNSADVISCQAEYNLLSRSVEIDLLPTVRRMNIGLLPFFPLASGLLTGKYTRDAPIEPNSTRAHVVRRFAERFIMNADWDALRRLQTFCDLHDCSMAVAALTWLLAQPEVSSVIAGATSPIQVKNNCRAVDCDLNIAELTTLAPLPLRDTAQ